MAFSAQFRQQQRKAFKEYSTETFFVAKVSGVLHPNFTNESRRHGINGENNPQNRGAFYAIWYKEHYHGRGCTALQYVEEDHLPVFSG